MHVHTHNKKEKKNTSKVFTCTGILEKGNIFLGYLKFNLPTTMKQLLASIHADL